MEQVKLKLLIQDKISNATVQSLVIVIRDIAIEIENTEVEIANIDLGLKVIVKVEVSLPVETEIVMMNADTVVQTQYSIEGII